MEIVWNFKRETINLGFWLFQLLLFNVRLLVLVQLFDNNNSARYGPRTQRGAWKKAQSQVLEKKN